MDPPQQTAEEERRADQHDRAENPVRDAVAGDHRAEVVVANEILSDFRELVFDEQEPGHARHREPREQPQAVLRGPHLARQEHHHEEREGRDPDRQSF